MELLDLCSHVIFLTEKHSPSPLRVPAHPFPEKKALVTSQFCCVGKREEDAAIYVVQSSLEKEQKFLKMYLVNFPEFKEIILKCSIPI